MMLVFLLFDLAKVELKIQFWAFFGRGFFINSIDSIGSIGNIGTFIIFLIN